MGDDAMYNGHMSLKCDKFKAQDDDVALRWWERPIRVTELLDAPPSTQFKT